MLRSCSKSCRAERATLRNLFLVSTGKGVPSWRIQLIYDVLLQRSVQNKPSVVYVEDLAALQKAYGAPFADFLGGFRQVKQ